MAEKERLDMLLVQKGIATSRQRAKAMIMEGNVFVDGVREDKAGSCFDRNAQIEYRGRKLRYVSRGGLKLEKALEVFPVDPEGKVCMDIGASTGGFTDCMLQKGAQKVYAIDVGYGQLDYRLRTDERVVCMEKTNFRYLKPEDIDERPQLATVDVSFISLDIILPVAYELIDSVSEMICLIKPQFEAGREKVEKKGVVRDKKVHEEVIAKAIDTAVRCGFTVKGLDYSPIKGPEGNIEYLMYLSKDDNKTIREVMSLEYPISETVEMAHGRLDT